MIQDASGLDYNNDHDDDNAALLKPTIDHVQLQITEDDLARSAWPAIRPRQIQQHAGYVAAQPHQPTRP